ncbi:MAG: hypothetical protein ABH879_00185 [archaeon]
MQLTHGGWCAQEPRTFRNMFGRGDAPPTDEEICYILAHIQNSALLAAQVGFDGVDIKGTHGYGIADWTLEKVREVTTLEEMTAKLNTDMPLIPLFSNIRAQAGRDDFMVMYRFSFFEGIPNGWGAAYDPDFDGVLVADSGTGFYQIEQDDTLPMLFLQAMHEHTDGVHSSHGVPALTPQQVRGTRQVNPFSIVDHMETASKAYRKGKEVSERDVPIIMSNSTTGGPAVLYHIADRRRRGEQPAYLSMGRESIANFSFPKDLHEGRYELMCRTCSACSPPLVHQMIPSGCVRHEPHKTIYGFHKN